MPLPRPPTNTTTSQHIQMADSSTPPETIFPPELEREIFEVAAENIAPVDILNLMLVAWRVKTWVEPVFYRVIFLERSETTPIVERLPPFSVNGLLALIDAKSNKGVLAHTRHLIMHDPATRPGGAHLRRLNAIMTACSGVTHVFLRSNKYLKPQELTALSGLPSLRFLGTHISKLFQRAPVDFAHPVFRNITHLEVLDTEKDLDGVPWTRLGDIPNLTHLAVSEMWKVLDVFDAVKARAPPLEALVFLATDRNRMLSSRRHAPWFVTVDYAPGSVYWQRHALTGVNYWGAADRFIADRKAGKVHVERDRIFLDSKYFS
ncbi:hypothetical protein C8R46DRAFT_1296979 [Mycena filopes]|nr:hypothetical protein C8R46DRAFT_1296979 [Mycena filopes]